MRRGSPVRNSRQYWAPWCIPWAIVILFGLPRWRHYCREINPGDTEDEGRVFVSTASRREYLRWLMI